MAKQYKVLVNTGKAENNSVIDVPRNATGKDPVRIKAKAGAKYQLQELNEQSGNKPLGPDYVKTKRVGKNLHILFEGDKEASVIIEDYYDVSTEGYNGLIGEAENGSFYEYIPEDPQIDGLVPSLRDGADAVNAALGGNEVNPAGAAVAALAIGPLAGLLGVGAAAAAVAGGGAGGTTVTTTGALTAVAGNDSGTLGDNITNNAKPALSGKVTAGSTATVTINGQTYPVTVAADGSWTFTQPDNLPDGTYNPVLNVTTNGQTTNTPITPFTIDTQTRVAIADAGKVGTTNTISGTAEAGDTIVLKDVNGNTIGTATANSSGQWSLTPTTALPSGNITATATDAASNTASATGTPVSSAPTTVAITGISQDTGVSASDFVTSDNNGLTINATLSTALATGQSLWYSKDNGVTWTNITTSVNGTAVSYADSTLTSTATVKMQVRDAAGNAAPTATQLVTIDASGNNNPDPVNPVNPVVDPNANNAKVSIDLISDDTGTSVTDFITKDNTLTYSGTVTGFTANGAAIKLVLVNNAGTEVASTYVTPTITSGTNGTWSWAYQTAQTDGQYELRATVVDRAGNTITGAVNDTQIILIDNSTGKNVDPTRPINNPPVVPEDDLNANATVSITTIHDVANGSTDSGASSTDFITNDASLVVKGTVTGFNATGASAGDKVLVQIVDSTGAVKATQYLTPDAAGNWTLNNTASNLADGLYTIQASIVDAAGNTVKAPVSHALVIDTNQGGTDNGSNPGNGPTNPVDPNTTATIAIGGITTDTGYSATDFITADGTLTISGTVTNFSSTLGAAGDKVRVQIVSSTGAVVAEKYTDPASGNWSFDNQSNLLADGSYTLKAAIVDAAGNVVKAAADQPLVISSSAAPTNAAVSIAAISQDTGTSATDFITNDQTLEVKGDTTSFNAGTDKLKVQIIDSSNTVVASDANVTVAADGSWTLNHASSGGVSIATLANGVYTLRASITDMAGNEVAGKTVTHRLVVDADGNNNPDNNPVVDPNTNATVSISTIHDVANGSTDSGASSNDFVTNDASLVIKGSTTDFSAAGAAAGDKVLVQILSGSTVVATQYLTPDSSGNWVMDNRASNLADGRYSISASIVDAAGNTVKAPVTQTLVIDTNQGGTDDGNNPGNNPVVDPNTTATIAIGGITTDSGYSASDFITNDGTLTINGTTNMVATGGAAGDKVRVQIVNSTGAVVAEKYTDPASGNWSFDNQANTLVDGTYTLKAAIVDAAGNVVKAAADQPLVINSGNTPTNATLAISAISDDTGVSTSDFVTSDNTLTITGTTNGYNAASGDKVLVQILSGSTVVSSGFVTPSNNSWSFNHTSTGTGGVNAATLADGTYTIRAVYTTAAGVPNSQPVSHSLVIDTNGGNNPDNNPVVDPNTTATVSIAGISDDTGSNTTDFATADQTLLIRGNTAGFNTAAGGAGDRVHVTLVGTGANAGVSIDQYLDVDGNGNWSLDNTANTLADGTYNVTATLVDRAGNRLNSAAGGQATQTITVAHSANPNDPNANTAKVSIDVISDDTGTSVNDFITQDHTLTYSGSVTGFTANGAAIKLVLVNNTGTEIASTFVTPTVTSGTNATWSWAYQTQQNDGQYELRATLVDRVGNAITGAINDAQIVIIDNSSGNNVGASDVPSSALGSTRPVSVMIDDASSRPNNIEPVSPMKMRAGLKLCGKNPRQTPMMTAVISDGAPARLKP